jgi:hypothetical protein
MKTITIAPKEAAEAKVTEELLVWEDKVVSVLLADVAGAPAIGKKNFRKIY